VVDVTISDVFMKIDKVLLDVSITDVGLYPGIIVIMVAYQQSVDESIHLWALAFGIGSLYFHKYSIILYTCIIQITRKGNFPSKTWNLILKNRQKW